MDYVGVKEVPEYSYLQKRNGTADPGLVPQIRLAIQSQPAGEYPGPIANSELLLPSSEENLLHDPDPEKEVSSPPVKSTVREHADFLVVPQELWAIWERVYGARTDIMRTVIMFSGKRHLDYCAFKVTVLFRPLIKPWVPHEPKVAYLRKDAHVSDLLEKCERIFRPLAVDPEKLQFRCWLTERSADEVARRVDSATPGQRIEIPAGRLLREDKPLREILADERDAMCFVVELAPSGKGFVMEEERPAAQCGGGNRGETGAGSGSTSLGTTAAKFPAVVSGDLSFIRTALCKCGTFAPLSKRGLVGLRNMSNTCYMNAALQCLSNCLELTKYFLLDRHKKVLSSLQPPVAKGRGELACRYAELIDALWRETKEKVAPEGLKDCLDRKTSQFRGHEQQDSQEFVLCLLDALHEDLNRAKTSLSSQRMDDGAGSDQWTLYREKNDSVIIDLFCGQLRSDIYCPQCKLSVAAYDPFTVISVPVPQMVSLPIVYVPEKLDHGMVKLKLPMQEGTSLSDVAKTLVTLMKLSVPRKLLFAAVRDGRIVQRLTESANCTEVAEKHDDLFAFDCGVDDGTDSRLIEIRVSTKSPSSYGARLATAKRPFVLALQMETTLAGIKLAVFSLLLPYLKSSSPPATVGTPQELYNRTVVKGKRPYTLSIVTFSGQGNTPRTKKCEFCGKLHDGNCEFDFDNEDHLTFSDLLKLMGPKRDLALSLVFSSTVVAFNTEKLLKHMDSSSQPTGTGTSNGKTRLTLCDCLNTIFKRNEELDQKNLWTCSHCKKEVRAIKHMTICRPPPVLIIHLKRFRQRQGRFCMTQRKVEDLVHYPIEGLDISPYLSTPELGMPKYNLFAVTEHYGSLSGGHYVAVCRSFWKKGWVAYDDSTLGLVKPEDVTNKNGYVLFYHREDVEKEVYC